MCFTKLTRPLVPLPWVWEEHVPALLLVQGGQKALGLVTQLTFRPAAWCRASSCAQIYCIILYHNQEINIDIIHQPDLDPWVFCGLTCMHVCVCVSSSIQFYYICRVMWCRTIASSWVSLLLVISSWWENTQHLIGSPWDSCTMK